MTPFVSVIIPCRNEEKHITRCLDSLVRQNYPKDKLEIIVVDGDSNDNTTNLVKAYAEIHPFIKILNNPQKFTPFALNLGIRNANGQIIIRADAHTEYPQDEDQPGYIQLCVQYLTEFQKDRVGNVGGSVSLPTIDGFKEIKKRYEKIYPGKKYSVEIARAIALCLFHPFGVASSFRLGTKKPIFTDTVFGGCYRKEIFHDIGFFNENLIRSQDFEFNLRLKRAGWRILLAPNITFMYYPKNSFRDFFKHNFEDGIWAIYPIKFTKRFFKIRHYIPIIFILIFLLTFILSIFSFMFRILFDVVFITYLFAIILFSLQIALKEGFKYLFLMPIAFISRHFGYGLGSLWGLVKLWIN